MDVREVVVGYFKYYCRYRFLQCKLNIRLIYDAASAVDVERPEYDIADDCGWLMKKNADGIGRGVS